MTRGRFPASLLLLCALAGGAALADDSNTLGHELRVFNEEIAAQCKGVREQLEDFKVRADPLTGYNLKDAVQSLCVCLPDHAQALTSTLSPEDLARSVTAEEFLALLGPAVTDRCAAEQMQSLYGEQCRKRFRKKGLDTSSYCACMKQVVSGYPDATAAAIANASSDYLPLAAEAEKKGEPAPPRPPVLESYYQADQDCKVRKP